MTPDLIIQNPPVKGGLTPQWASALMSRLRPGGRWFLPRSISTVLVLSTDPKIAHAQCVFPDPTLLATLAAAGWTIQARTESN